MSVYGVQKLIRDVNRNPGIRARFFEEPEAVAASYPLTQAESAALVDRDFGALYRLGVHGLLLRPFSILHEVSESEYLSAIREERGP